MTLSELLALVGRAWPRLLIYPGGLAMFLAVLLAFYLSSRLPNRQGRKERQEAKQLFMRFLLLQSPFVVATPWLAVALLPFPGAVDLGRGIDMVILFVLLEIPLFAVLKGELASKTTQQRGAQRLAAALNGYPTLVLSTLLLASAGSLELGQLIQAPTVLWPAAIMHWAGTVGLLAALPPVIGFGPFALPSRPQAELSLWLRGVGYWALAALPWMMLLEGQLWQILPPLLLALLIGVFHFRTCGQPALRWARAYLMLSIALLLVLLAGAAWQLVQRLQ